VQQQHKETNMSGTNYREAAQAYLNIKDLDEVEIPSEPTTGLLSRTNNKSMSTDTDEPIDRVTRYVHAIRKQRNEIKNGRA